MTDLPPQAITAALDVLAARGKPRGRSITFGDAGLRAAVTAALEAAAPHLAAAEREACAHVWRTVLTEHYLAGITCDHETRRDNPVCACSRVHLDWHPTIGAAVQAWLDHVSDAALLRKDHP